MNSWNPGSFT